VREIEKEGTIFSGSASFRAGYDGQTAIEVYVYHQRILFHHLACESKRGEAWLDVKYNGSGLEYPFIGGALQCITLFVVRLYFMRRCNADTYSIVRNQYKLPFKQTISVSISCFASC